MNVRHLRDLLPYDDEVEVVIATGSMKYNEVQEIKSVFENKSDKCIILVGETEVSE